MATVRYPAIYDLHDQVGYDSKTGCAVDRGGGWRAIQTRHRTRTSNTSTSVKCYLMYVSKKQPGLC